MAGRGFIRVEAQKAFRELNGQFKYATDSMLRDWRSMMRDEGRKAKKITQDEAPEGKTGKFKKGIRFRTFQRTKTIMGFTISMPQPLGTYITEGTKPHRIAAKHKKALVFFWDKVGMKAVVPKGGGFKTHERGDVLWIGKGYIDHPGTKKNPFHKRAKRRWWPAIAKRMKRRTLKYAADLTK